MVSIQPVVPLYSKMGWGLPQETIKEKHYQEAIHLEKAVKANPFCYQQNTTAITILPALQTKFNKLQEAAGRNPKSKDMSLLDYFVFGKRLRWFQQDGGTCVWSNTFRMIVERMLFEISMRGDPEEFFGRNEFSANSIAPHCVQYGFARQIANMRGGDGLYGAPMARSLTEGMVMCNTSKLIELMKAAGADDPINYPEPRNLSLYRKIGNWAWNQLLQQYRDYRVTETAPVKSIEDHDFAAENWKPMFQCSGIAIKAVGKHKDGFIIHDEDTRDSWSHNMGWSGKLVASDDDQFYRLSNRSWLQNTKPNEEWTGPPNWDSPFEKFMYNIPRTTVERWYRQGKVETFTIGEIQMPEPIPQV